MSRLIGSLAVALAVTAATAPTAANGAAADQGGAGAAACEEYGMVQAVHTLRKKTSDTRFYLSGARPLETYSLSLDWIKRRASSGSGSMDGRLTADVFGEALSGGFGVKKAGGRTSYLLVLRNSSNACVLTGKVPRYPG